MYSRVKWTYILRSFACRLLKHPLTDLRDLKKLDYIIILFMDLVQTIQLSVNPSFVSGMYPVWFNVSAWEKGSSH